jgi:hypothetical protein
VVDGVQREEELLNRSVVRLHGVLLGMATGVITGLIIFVATLWLVLKGGEEVGTHLALLSQFFWGYSVTWGGSFLGLAYGFVLGFIVGTMIAWIYNRVAALSRSS